MSIIVSVADFTGEQSIATDAYSQDELTSAIDTFEKPLLYKMLGVELADLFIADLDSGEPQSQRFIDIFESWYKDIDGSVIESKGIKDMLVKYIFFHYVRKQPQDNTIQGNVQNIGTINTDSKMSFMTLTLQYNDAIKTLQAIQSFIESESATYPEYKGMFVTTMCGI